MSEFGFRDHEALKATVRKSENEYEDSLREVFLASTLFHDEHLMRALENPGDYIDDLTRLQRDFLDEKKDKNMGERFALALSDKYLGKIHVVELGKTSDPGASGEIDGLKDDYHDLLRWMIEQGLVERELSRQESGRSVGLRKPVAPEAGNKLAIMTRNRPLIHNVIEHDGKKAGITIAKRMVFSVPLATLGALNGRTTHKDLDFNDPASLEQIETMLQHGSGGINPIRTAYYLATELK